MTLLQNNFTNNQNVQTITQTLKNTFHHLKYGPDFKKYDNTMEYPLFFRTNNERLNDRPIYIKIKRNFNDEYATLTFKIHSDLVKQNFRVWAMNEFLDIKNVKEIENGYYQYEIYQTNSGKKLLFDKLDRLISFSGNYKRVHNTLFGIDLRNMNINTNVTNTSLNSSTFKYSYIYEINYKITGSSLFNQTFEIDKDSSIFIYEITGNIWYPKFREEFKKLLELKYRNISPKQKQILPMNNVLKNLFSFTNSYLSLNSYVLDNMLYKINLKKTNYEWTQSYDLDSKYKYDKISKEFIISNDNDSRFNYYFPLDFIGKYSYSLDFKNWFEKDKKTRFEYNGEISQKIFDPLHGLVKLKINQSNLNNSNIENMINNWKYHAL